MIISRRVAWIMLIAAILTASLLRQFHAKTPISPFLPAPIGSLLFFLVLILFLVFLRGWGMRQEIPYAGSDLKRFNLLAMIPFLIALMAEKWVSITLYGPLFHRINAGVRSVDTFNALYLLESALGLLLVSVLLLPLFRRLFPLLKNLLKPKRVPIAALGLALAVGGVYVVLALLFTMGSGQRASLRWTGFGRDTGLILAGQGLLGFAEELYYRGILQSEMAFFLPAMGLAKERLRQGFAVLLISIAFALEHFIATGSSSVDTRRFVFTFASSLFLGLLLVLMENLWFSGGCHFVLNVFMLGTEMGGGGRGLQLVDQEGRSIFEPTQYVFLFLIFAFVVAYLRHALYARLYPKQRRRPAATEP